MKEIMVDILGERKVLTVDNEIFNQGFVVVAVPLTVLSPEKAGLQKNHYICKFTDETTDNGLPVFKF